MKTRLSRRSFLKASMLAAASVSVASCVPQATDVAQPAPTQAVQPTSTAASAEVGETAPAVTKAVTSDEQPVIGSAEKLLGDVPPNGLLPGSPNHPKGWKTIIPELTNGAPYPEPVEITTFKRVDGDTKYYHGEDINNNIWTKSYEALYGLKYKVLWTYVTGEEGRQKLGLAIASGQIPDLMPGIELDMFQEMLDADMLEDLTDHYENYASPFVKDTMEWGDHIMWSYAEINGRKMAWPEIELASQNEKEMWYREDWLEQLGLEVPKTINELHDAAKAMVDAQLGQGATVGVLAANWLSGWYASLDPIFGAFGVQTSYYNSYGCFTDDGQGGLRFDGIQPEMKEALAYLAGWYKDGVLQKDFHTIDQWEPVRGLCEGNKTGFHFTHFWGGTYGCAQGSMKNDPNARWNWADVPVNDTTGKRGKFWQNPVLASVRGIRKGFERIERVFAQINLEAEWTSKQEDKFRGWETYHYAWNDDGSLDVRQLEWWHDGLGLLYDTGSIHLDPERQAKRTKYFLDQATTPKEERDAYVDLQLEDPTGMNKMMNESYLWQVSRSLTEDTIKNRFSTMPTSTMSEKWSQLYDLTQQTYLDIIIGNKPADSFDAYAKQWLQQGGQTVLDEVNEWWSSRK